MLKDLLDYRLSVRQLVYLAITVGALIGLPYLVTGLIWASIHQDHLKTLTGADQLFSMLGEIIAWPVLLVADVNLV